MFSIFRKFFAAKTPPAPAEPVHVTPFEEAPRPLEIVRGKVAFSREGRTWTEEFDVVEILSRVLAARGFFTTPEGDSLRLDTSGFLVRPVLASFGPRDDGGSRSTTVTRVCHEKIGGQGLYEYQHSFGPGLNESIGNGFEQWSQIDLVVLLDALADKPEYCTAMELTFPPTDDAPGRRRRVLLGPTGHLAERPPDGPGEEHPFCACCLFTRSMEAFKPLVETDAFFGVRLFASRDARGEAQADCRVNGEEFEAGKEALRAYVQTWPDAGVELRKQYIVIQSRDPADPE